MNLQIPEDILSYFAAHPIGLWFSVPDLRERSYHPLCEPFKRFLASLPAAALEQEIADPFFRDYCKGKTPEEETAVAQELAMIHALSSVIPVRRLASLSASQNPPAPYDHPAVRDLTVDADGLVQLTEFEYDGAVLKRNGFAFLPAPPLPAPHSSYWLLQHLARPDLRNAVRLRLDPFMFGPADTFPALHYKMYLYGQPLDWKRLAALKEPEYGQWKLEDSTGTGHCTDYVWNPRGDGLHFVCEELPGEDQLSIQGARYLHAIYDAGRQVIVHLDGALRIYDEGSFRERVATRHVRHAGKSGRRVKLFRTDQPISRDRFADVAAAFFVGNRDVTEYFCSRATRAA